MTNKNMHPDSDGIILSQKYLDKIVKMQQDQEESREKEYELLQTHLSLTNVLLDRLIKISGSGSTVASTKKFIPFQTGNQDVGQLLTQPSNPDNYPTVIGIYKMNDNMTIPHMTLINDGPGDVFFISVYSNNQFNTKEEHLNINDQRELFNVYEIRLRSTLPTTTVRLIEGIFRTGGTAPQTVSNTVIKPTIQSNQTTLTFSAIFDVNTPTINITSPIVQTFPALNFINPAFQTPLPPGQTAVFVNNTTGIPEPFTIPEGFILEAFSISDNMSTEHTLRNWIEIVPGTFTLINTNPVNARGAILNLQLNLGTQFTTRSLDINGAPVGGRKTMFTVTNDDPFANMIGTIEAIAILTRLV